MRAAVSLAGRPGPGQAGPAEPGARGAHLKPDVVRRLGHGRLAPVADLLDTLVDSWLTFPQVAERLGLSATKVRQLARERQLVAVRRADLREPAVPAECLTDDGQIVKGLGGTLTLLGDHGFSDEESIAWLFTPDDSLPGRPIDALRADRGREVRRRAQAVD